MLLGVTQSDSLPIAEICRRGYVCLVLPLCVKEAVGVVMFQRHMANGGGFWGP
jgi:hypothetical protein